jgi:flagellar hook-associated protein 1 FlgK
LGNLFTTVLNTANNLKALENGFATVENNVANANTAGYASQTQTFQALPFDLSVGLPGGVNAGPVESSRDAYAEQAVRNQQTALGVYTQKVADLTPVESFFSLSTTSGIEPAMNTLFASFSQLSINPNDAVSRQLVLSDASTVAEQFQDAATGMSNQQSEISQQAQSTIANINQLAGAIASVNASGRVDASGQVNAGLDAQMNSSLEQLSQLVNFTTLQQPDGTVSVYIAGQTPLVSGAQAFDIQGDTSSPQIAVLSSTGADITSQITGGQLSGLIDDNNNVIPGYVTQLNTLAQSLADQVNSTLDQGVDETGTQPITDLFAYDPTLGAASTLSVNPLTPNQIAAALPGATGGNGNALNLAQLANATNLNGQTFAQFYGSIGAQVGSDVSAALNGQTTEQSLLTQAQTLRQQASGVSLNAQATQLIEYQQSYDATAKMLTVLDELTESIMSVIT